MTHEIELAKRLTGETSPTILINFKHLKTVFHAFVAKWSGVLKYLEAEEKDELRVILLGDEAVQTSKIEGEYLDRDSIQSSIRRHFGLQITTINKNLKEQGVSDLLVDVYQNFPKPLSHDMLRLWQKKRFSGAPGTGEYRTHEESTQVLSGAIYVPTVHFETPSFSSSARCTRSLYSVV